MRDIYVLQCLDREDNVNMCCIANELVSTASVTNIITKLAKKGLAKRVDAKGDDRRKVYVRITKKGREVLNG